MPLLIELFTAHASCMCRPCKGVACHVQAGLQDNPPVYILGGNIIPLGASGLMTTTALRASNLSLLAAFPSAHSAHFERCGQGCTAQSTANRSVTCGHMYLDHGASGRVLHRKGPQALEDLPLCLYGCTRHIIYEGQPGFQDSIL